MSLLAANPTINIIDANTQYANLANLRPSNYVTAAIDLLLGTAGVIAFIYLLWGGINWIMAGSDKEALEKSRKRIVNALVGLAIIFSSYALLFIIQALFNVDLISFTIKRIGT